ncbi:phosphonate ABC transporter ATP-binding protein [Roseibium algae]|uniref:Phosphonate ABC transporter ATP-binding protein n=1 Tax=Roseibium algae TaxID=3123038 RepID=A0ABU8TJK6_9HYPH
MSAIVISGLSKTYLGNTRALDRVSLSVGQGEMVALIGASGSGKSTLIRHIAGLVCADKNASSCKICVDGAVVQEGGRISRNISATRTEIGVIFQQFNLVPRLSVLNNVLAGLLGKLPVLRGMLGLFHKHENQLAMQALQRVGIAHAARQRASTLSGGQQQRAAIARTLVQGAKVILADEPIASLDPASAKRVMGILSRINVEDGITVLVSLHQVEYARRYCKRTIAMRAGQVVFDGPSSELTTQFLREIYGEASEELILPDADDFGTEPMTALA